MAKAMEKREAFKEIIKDYPKTKRTLNLESENQSGKTSKVTTPDRITEKS